MIATGFDVRESGTLALKSRGSGDRGQSARPHMRWDKGQGLPCHGIGRDPAGRLPFLVSHRNRSDIVNDGMATGRRS